MSDSIKLVTDQSFDSDVINSNIPVLIDFWAEWCGPCKSIAPIIEEISLEYTGRLLVCKINIDDNQVTPSKFSVRGIPTFLLFKNGAVVSQKVGAAPKSELTSWIDSNL
jgi:thioredoxin 1